MRVFRDFDHFTVYRIKQLLDDSGVPCYLKNEYIAGAIGEVSPLDAQPEVWIADDEWQPKAQRLIDTFMTENQAKQGQASWLCSGCQEVNEPSFNLCWQCGTARPD
ncbi:DUF2007 domain-containing protein [Alteromonas sp. SM 2104]|nr:DUF2007 domain-containing protein [Alteromonas oceanisediminis]